MYEQDTRYHTVNKEGTGVKAVFWVADESQGHAVVPIELSIAIVLPSLAVH